MTIRKTPVGDATNVGPGCGRCTKPEIDPDDLDPTGETAIDAIMEGEIPESWISAWTASAEVLSNA